MILAPVTLFFSNSENIEYSYNSKISNISEIKENCLKEDLIFKHTMFGQIIITGENFSSDDKKDESTQKIINAYNLQTESYKAIVKNLKSNEYKGESISVYFSKDYALNTNDYKIGDKLRVYGLVTYCQNNGVGNYNSVSFIPRFIEK